MPIQPARVRKVSAYPIAAQFKDATSAFPAQIVKLTQTGFLAEVDRSTIQTSERFECSFELSVSRQFLTENVVVVKIYSQWGNALDQTPQRATEASQSSAAGASSQSGASSAQGQTSNTRSVHRLVEAHFTNLATASRAHITAFLNALAKSK